MKRDYITVNELIETTEFGFSYNQETKCIEADCQAWDAYFRAHLAVKHLKGRMFPHFVEVCVIFGNDFSHHTVNVGESFGQVVEDTSQAESVLGDTQVESGESFCGHGESSSVVDDTTPSPLSGVFIPFSGVFMAVDFIFVERICYFLNLVCVLDILE